MEIKLGLLIKSRNALEKLNNTEGIDALTAYRISKNMRVSCQKYLMKMWRFL